MKIERHAEDQLRKLEEIFTMDKETVVSRFGSIFYVYFRKMFESNYDYFPHMVKRAEHILKLTGSQTETVLDFGCGPGLWTILIGILGDVRHVYGIDRSEEKINALNAVAMHIGIEDKVTGVLGDGHKLEYQDGHFDLCMANDVLSHVMNLDKSLSEITRTLKNGGAFFMYDGNNSLNLVEKIEMRKRLEQCENGPVNAKYTGLSDTYVNMRRNIIRSEFKDISETTIETMAKKTKGMHKDQIKRACEQYLKNGKIDEVADFLYRNPRTGEKMEFSFNPYQFKKELDNKYGLKCRVLPVFTSTPITWKNIAGKIIKHTHPFSLLFAPGFELIGIKK